MSDARFYVPEEALVRATVDASGGGASAYVPSELVVARVLARSRLARSQRARVVRPMFRWPQRESERPIGRSPIVAAAAALGFAPSVLAAAVVIHVAVAIAAARSLGGVTLGADSLRGARMERIAYVALQTPAPVATPDPLGADVRRELAIAVDQRIAPSRLATVDVARLQRSAALLRRFPGTRVRIEADTSVAAQATAREIQNIFAQAGVARDRSTITTTRTEAVHIVLDPARP